MEIYWIFEYGKVSAAYACLMFLWPTVVFWKYLKDKTKIFRFSFCVTVQIVLVNTVVLGAGLFGSLNMRLTAGLFYGVFLISLCKRGKESKEYFLRQKDSGRKVQKLWRDLRTEVGEYAVLFFVTVFGMAYFSYGALQMHSYGQNDVFTHHAWVERLLEGEIFSNGVYPQAMHCFIYCLHALFGIRIYSVMLFLQCIHVTVFLLSAYCLLREIFCWRYSPVFVLGLYLTLDFIIYHSMSRLQAALPMEFGLHTQFLCGLYLLRYLKSRGTVKIGNRRLPGCWNKDLLLFMMSICASIATHYYTTIMAFILCASIALFQIKKWIRPGYLFPLLFSAACGCIFAAAPMAGGLLSGIPFEGSVSWAIHAAGVQEEKEGAAGGALELSDGDLEVIEKLPVLGQNVMKTVIKTEYLVRVVLRKGYKAMYWDEDGGKRGSRIWKVTLAAAALCLISRYRKGILEKEVRSKYFSVILVSFLSMFLFAACDDPGLGLPVLIADHRYGSTGHMMTLAVMIIPADFLFSVAARFWNDHVLQAVSWIAVVCIYLFTNLTGIFHEYLFWVMFQYPASVQVTESIIREFPQGSCTVVSPREEPYQLASYGQHEEISDFIRKCGGKSYALSTEYVFLYMEKRPLVYFQNYYLTGPAWLAKSRDSIIEAAEISKEAAAEEFRERDAIWDFYIDNRTVLESKIYEWYRYFSGKYPGKMKTYYEDDHMICWYFRQDPQEPYDLSFGRKE